MTGQAAAVRDPVLREMRWWDIDQVMALEAELFPHDAWSRGMFWSELAGTRHPGATRCYLVAEAPAQDTAETPAEARLVGYAGLSAVAGTADVTTIGVTAGHQGTGVGARLLAELLRRATAFECHEVLLEVRVDNAPAQRLYQRFGFEPIGLRRGYYPSGGAPSGASGPSAVQPAVDALVMRLVDPSTVPAGEPRHG